MIVHQLVLVVMSFSVTAKLYTSNEESQDKTMLEMLIERVSLEGHTIQGNVLILCAMKHALSKMYFTSYVTYNIIW